MSASSSSGGSGDGRNPDEIDPQLITDIQLAREETPPPAASAGMTGDIAGSPASSGFPLFRTVSLVIVVAVISAVLLSLTILAPGGSDGDDVDGEPPPPGGMPTTTIAPTRPTPTPTATEPPASTATETGWVVPGRNVDVIGGAEGGSRTHTRLPSTVFETV